MGLGRSQPVVWILLVRGYKPKKLIELGYTETLVYRYNARLSEVKIELKEMVAKLKAKKQ